MRGRAAWLAAAWLGCAGAGTIPEPDPAAAPVPAWEEPPPPVADGPIVPWERLHASELANGLRLLILEDRRLPWVSMGITVRRGSTSVAPEQAGLAEFTAELMRRGAGGRDAEALEEAVEALGARLAVSAGWDSAEAAIAGLSRDRDALLELLADVVLRPRFDPQEAVRLRAQTLAALEKAKDDPGTLARWNLARALFEGHAFGLPSAGTPETVSKLDARAAAALHRSVWIPGNALFFASGDVRAEALRGRVEALFGAWRGATPPPDGPPAPQRAPAARRLVVVDRPELVQAQIVVGHEGPRRSDPERIAANLLNDVLGGGGFSSRIMTAIRREAGLAYFAYSTFGQRRQGGVFAAATATRVPEVGRAVSMLLEELEKARRQPPDAEELRHAQSFAAGRFALGLETSQDILAALVELDVQGLPQDSLDTYRARIRAVSEADLAEQARKRLHPERAAIVVVGPAAAVVPQLEALGPAEVVVP